MKKNVLKMLPQSLAIQLMLALLTLVVVFHCLVLTGVIPFTIVWAGKLNSTSDMVVFESVSIAINVVLIIILLLKAAYIRQQKSQKILNVIIIAFAILFSLNTVGNLFSKTKLELYLFTPLTLLSAFLCWSIIAGNKKQASKNHTTHG